MLSENQKRFTSLLYSCPLQDCVYGCALGLYRTSFPVYKIARQVKKFNDAEILTILNKHDSCFKKRNAEFHIGKINRQLEIKKILSERQFQVVKLICKNYTNNDVAEKLKISLHTVVNHRRKIYKRLNINSVKELKCKILKKDIFY